jgi:hypothetical protein
MKQTTLLPSIANDNEAQSTLALRHSIFKAWCLIIYQNKWMFIFFNILPDDLTFLIHNKRQFLSQLKKYLMDKSFYSLQEFSEF